MTHPPPRTWFVRPQALALLAMMALLATLIPLGAISPVGAAPGCPADKSHLVPWQGGRWFLSGANVPWQNGGFGADFGTVETWGQHTYSSTTTDRMFADLRATGSNSVRWWVFADGRGAPEFSNGFTTGFDANTLPSMADAIKLAEKHNIYLTFTLWSFDMLFAGDGPAGGKRDLIVDAARRKSFIDNAIIPMLRYQVPGTSYTIGTHPNVISWEIINEPEWGIRESGSVHGNIREPVSLAEMQRFIAETTGAIHRNSNQLVTVGAAAMKWNSATAPGAVGNWYSDAALKQYDPQGALDYYQIHYYAWQNGDANWSFSPMRVSWQQGTFDKPVVVGEFPANASGSGMSVQQMLERIFGNCYAGAWSWGYHKVDGNGGWAETAPGMAQFNNAHRTEVAIAGGAPPQPTAATPTAVSPAPTAPPADPVRPPSLEPPTVLYDDRIAAGWQDWSWQVTTEPQASVAGQLGNAALGVTYSGRGGGLKLHRDAPFTVTASMLLQFRIHGGSGGARLRVELRDGATIFAAPGLLEPAPGRWSLVAIPLAHFVPTPTRVNELVIRDDNGARIRLALDQIQLGALPRTSPAPTPPLPLPQDRADVPIYADSLAVGWREDSWGATTDLAATTERFSGSHAVAAHYTTGWGGMRFTATNPFPRAGLQILRLALHGDTAGGQRIRVILRPSTGAEQRLATVTLNAGQWQRLTLPLPDATALPDIASLVLQDDTGTLPPPFYLDEVALLTAAGAPAPTAPPSAVPSPVSTSAPPTATAIPAKGALRVMPLGDSITEGVNGGYRNRLWERLVADGRVIDFVGPRTDRWTRIADKDHAGTPGYTVGNILGQIDGWLASYRPDVILLMAGTNDLAWWHVEGPEATAARLGALLDRIKDRAPQTVVIVASIPPMQGAAPPNNRSRDELARAYNAAVRAQVEQRKANGTRLAFADVYAALTVADLYDGIHPTEAAHYRIADIWYGALGTLLR